jgi:dihydrofolate reductase
LIVAMSRNRVIGRDNRLPWHLPADLKRFKALTMGHHIIMGRKTWASINRLLPGRITVIVSRDRKLKVEGAHVVYSLDDAFALCRHDSEVFVIGGAEIFTLALPRANRLYLTIVEAEVEGDTHLPPIDLAQWRVITAESHPATEDTPLAWSFTQYERVTDTQAAS